MSKKIFSGVQPTGNLHLGNYLGAIKNFVELNNDEQNECIFCVVDLHAITVKQNKDELNNNIPNTHKIGSLLYTEYIYVFQISGLILLVAMVGAIVLTLRDRPGVKKQDIISQNTRKVSDVISIVKKESS